MAVEQAAPTAYDDVPYPTNVNANTHPEALAVLARLYGVEPPPVGTCRVLEVGCGDGGNLIPMAAALPNARFHGFDLARSAVAKGQADIEALGLRNITLEAADLLEVAERPDRYDYVIAHGFYTWVPEAVREGLLTLFGRALAPGGLVFMTYNVAQGCHIRRQLRDAIELQMRLTGVGRTDPQGVARIIDFICEGAQADQPYGQALKAEASLWRNVGAEVALHDILSPDYATYRFHEVAERLAGRGLDYLGEADAYALRREMFPTELDREVRRRAGDDPVIIEEIYDDLFARPFRLSVFRRREDGVGSWRRPMPTAAAVSDLHVGLSPEISADPSAGEMKGGVWSMVVRGRDGVRAQLTGEGMRQAIEHLRRADPCSVPAAEFGASPEAASSLALLYSIGVVRLFMRPTPVVGDVSARPRAFPPAALYALRGSGRSPRADHISIELDPEYTQLMTLLDGQRSHAEIAAAAAERFGHTLEEQSRRLPYDLEILARAGVLVA